VSVERKFRLTRYRLVAALDNGRNLRKFQGRRSAAPLAAWETIAILHGEAMSYFDGYLISVRTEKLEAYKRFSEQIAKVYREHGAIRIVDCVLDADATDGAQFHAVEARDALHESAGALRDFRLATAIEAGETVVLSWTEWPSKAARDSGLANALSDPRVQPKEGQDALFEGRRLIAGGFAKLIDV
jgi:uncharacterized protein YbaA (DUF1428 family)